MAYLHGIVADTEFEAACDYEFARESRVLREASRSHGQGLNLDELGEEIDQAFTCGGLFLQSPWFEFFTCAHFPESPWNSLSAEDRREILRTLRLPFGKGQLRSVDLGTLERLQTAERLTAGQRSPVLLDFNWANAKKQSCHGFAAWLDRPENKERLEKHRNRRTGKTGGHVDRLKDLAAWRLFDHCGAIGERLMTLPAGIGRSLTSPMTLSS